MRLRHAQLFREYELLWIKMTGQKIVWRGRATGNRRFSFCIHSWYSYCSRCSDNLYVIILSDHLFAHSPSHSHAADYYYMNSLVVHTQYSTLTLCSASATYTQKAVRSTASTAPQFPHTTRDRERDIFFFRISRGRRRRNLVICLSTSFCRYKNRHQMAMQWVRFTSSFAQFAQYIWMQHTRTGRFVAGNILIGH